MRSRLSDSYMNWSLKLKKDNVQKQSTQTCDDFLTFIKTTICQPKFTTGFLKFLS